MSRRQRAVKDRQRDPERKERGLTNLAGAGELRRAAVSVSYNRARVRDLLVHAKCLSIAAIASAGARPVAVSRLRCRDCADQPR